MFAIMMPIVMIMAKREKLEYLKSRRASSRRRLFVVESVIYITY